MTTERSIYSVYGTKPARMTARLMEAADIAARIPAGASVALKPNLVVAREPSSGATTHKEVLDGVLGYLRDHGFTDLSIMEGAWVGDSTQRGFTVCGYREVAEKYGVPLIDLKHDGVRRVRTAIGDMDVCERALDTDYLISLPVMKGHCQTVMTCALKNSKGCLPDSEKRRFHTLGLHKPIAALAAVLKPALTIVDSLCGDLSFEEGGTPIATNRMLLGFDQVQLDAYCCALMGVDPAEVPYIGYAEAYGAGRADWTEADIVALNEPDPSAAYPKPSGVVKRLTRGVEAKSACSACYGNLVHALYRLEQKGGHVHRPVCIGQGFRGETIDGVGIGRCCQGAAVCVPGCPPSAERILRALENAD